MSAAGNDISRLHDEISRQKAARNLQPDWQAQLDELAIANAGNPDFWIAIQRMHAQGAGWYGGKCRICRRPLPAGRITCDWCDAYSPLPGAVRGTVLTMREIAEGAPEG